LSTYKGSLRSCSGKIDVLGEIAVQQFIIDPAQPHLLGKTNLVVANLKATNEILLGRDIMSMFPQLKEAMDRKRDVVHRMTTDITLALGAASNITTASATTGPSISTGRKSAFDSRKNF